MHYWHGNAKTGRTVGVFALSRSHCHLELNEHIEVRRSAPGGGAVMEMRVFGRTGMRLSVLGFGCGAVGGLMVRGDSRDQERTIARAIDAGVNYFDTAVQYGDGEFREKSRLCLAKAETGQRDGGHQGPAAE